MTERADSGRDAELLADAMLAAVEDDAGGDAAPDAVRTAVNVVRRLGVDFVRRYHRLDLSGADTTFDGPVLFVANHGFGGIFDLNVLAIIAAFDAMALDRPVTALTHQSAWILGAGPIVEAFGARPASRESAEQAFAAGHHVLVLPGGDVDAFKSFADRDKIVFAGRRGFARLATEAGVPVVPIVTAGAGESLLVLSDGARLARAMRLDRALRLKRFPVTVSLPWGINVGGVGMLPYLPLPTKLRTRVLEPMHPAGQSAEDFGTRVEQTMQEALTALVTHRKPLLG